MGTDHSYLTKKMEEYFASEQCKRHVEEYWAREDEIAKRRDIRTARINSISSEDFERLMQYIIASNDEKHIAACYRKGEMPYPTGLLDLVMSASEKYGENVSGVWQKKIGWDATEAFKYRGYVFFTIYGQGTASGVYKIDPCTGSEIIKIRL